MIFAIKSLMVCTLLGLSGVGVAGTLNARGNLAAKKIDISIIPQDRKGVALTSIPLNQLLSLSIRFDGDADMRAWKLVRFTAEMPAHRHGMVTRPTVRRLSNHEYLIDGVKLHMPGMWELKFFFEQENNKAFVAMPLNL